MINVPLLQKALDHIEQHPEEWRQGSWGMATSLNSCGTAACLAGHIVLIDGWTPIYDEEGSPTPSDRFGHEWEAVNKDGRIEPVSEAAREALGVESVHVEGLPHSYLFAGDNKREDLWRIANLLTDGQLTLPMDLQ